MRLALVAIVMALACACASTEAPIDEHGAELEKSACGTRCPSGKQAGDTVCDGNKSVVTCVTKPGCSGLWKGSIVYEYCQGTQSCEDGECKDVVASEPTDAEGA